MTAHQTRPRRFAWLCTPPGSRGVIRSLKLTILAAPLVVAAHFFVRLVKGHYPWYADAIVIPISTFAMIVFPLTLVLLSRGRRDYQENVFLFTWGRDRFWHSLFWTLSLIFPALVSIGMFIDSLEGRLYWASAFFLLHLYALLVLRASIVSATATRIERASHPSSNGESHP